MEDALREVIIANATFGDSTLEISFIETRDQTETAGLVKSLIVQTHNYAAKIEEIYELLEEIIDAGLTEIRNPPETIDPRKRLQRRNPPVSGKSDDAEG